VYVVAQRGGRFMKTSHLFLNNTHTLCVCAFVYLDKFFEIGDICLFGLYKFLRDKRPLPVHLGYPNKFPTLKNQ
jgi:hypothetical protein